MMRRAPLGFGTELFYDHDFEVDGIRYRVPTGDTGTQVRRLMFEVIDPHWDDSLAQHTLAGEIDWNYWMEHGFVQLKRQS